MLMANEASNIPRCEFHTSIAAEHDASPRAVGCAPFPMKVREGVDEREGEDEGDDDSEDERDGEDEWEGDDQDECEECDGVRVKVLVKVG